MTKKSEDPKPAERDQQKVSIDTDNFQNEEGGITQDEKSEEKFVLKPTDRFYFQLGGK